MSRLTQAMTNSQYQKPKDPPVSWLMKALDQAVERGRQERNEFGAGGDRCSILSTSSSYQSMALKGKRRAMPHFHIDFS